MRATRLVFALLLLVVMVVSFSLSGFAAEVMLRTGAEIAYLQEVNVWVGFLGEMILFFRLR